MKVISFVTQKGGSGKSTLTISCAVAALKLKKKVLIVDIDPQGTSEDWFQKRDFPEPRLLKITTNELSKALEAARNVFDVVLVDTPGRDEPCISAVIKNSDYCIVPCRPSPADMKAMPTTIATIKRLEKNCAFVLNQTPVRGARIKEAEVGLSILANVCPIYIPSRTAYQDAHGAGLGVMEYEPNGKAAVEIQALWGWIWKKMEKLGK